MKIISKSKKKSSVTTSIRYPSYLDIEVTELCNLFRDANNMSISKNRILTRAIEIGLPIVRNSFNEKLGENKT